MPELGSMPSRRMLLLRFQIMTQDKTNQLGINIDNFLENFIERVAKCSRSEAGPVKR